MTRLQAIENAATLLFACVFALVWWQSQFTWVLWPTLIICGAALAYVHTRSTTTERARRAQAKWAAPLILVVMGALYAWRALRDNRPLSLPLAGVLAVLGLTLFLARRKSA